MKTIINPPLSSFSDLCKRPQIDRSSLLQIVSEIMNNVKLRGDKALYEYTKKFDRAEINSIRLPESEISNSGKFIPDYLKKAILRAKANIEMFHNSQLCEEKMVETAKGVKCWRKNIPIEKAGLYIPGGTAPLFSTVLMLAVPAKIANCSRIILCTPPDENGNVNPLILYSAKVSGVTDFFRVGGAQAITAMAFGTESIPRVDKIFGPGNQFVTKAKELVQMEGIPIDIPAGPSEVLVIADRNADPSFVAADLLSQAEHGTDSQVVLLSTSMELIESTKSEIDKQLAALPRKEIAVKALENSMIIFFDTTVKCMEFSNHYAPEHLIINTSDSYALAGMVINAGSVFLGKYSCESAGDYATGTNHTLPTNGFARNFSGVSTESFVKKITFQELSAEGIKDLGPSIQIMAEAEQLDGHKNAVTLRLKSFENV